MKRSFVIIAAIVVALLAIGAVFGWERTSASASATNTRLQTVTVQRGTLVATVSAAGNVSAPQESTLAFQTTGRVAQVNVKVGDIVKQGQVLMQLDTTDLDLALKTAQAGLASAQANYDSAKIKASETQNQLIVAKAALDKATAALQLAQNNYNSVATRPDVGMTSQAASLQSASLDYQSALATYNITASGINDDSALKVAQAQLDNAQTAVAQAQSNLDKAKAVAPFDGIVNAVNYNVGDTVGTSAAADIVDLRNLQVKVQVAEVDMAKIKVGETVQMTLDALPGKTFDAKVMAIDPVGTITQGVVNYSVIVSISNADSALKPGMTANLAVVVDQRDNVLMVPARAVRAVGNRKIVTVLSKGQTIQTPVSTGLANDQSVEITSGLQEGDVVVLNQTQTQTRQPNVGGFGFPGLGGRLGGG